MTDPHADAHAPPQRRADSSCMVARTLPVVHAAGPIADACHAVLKGYEAGLSPLDAEMLERLVPLADLVPSILADEARLTMAFGALRQVLLAFDNAENRDAERHPQAAAALQMVYRLLGLKWPALL